MQRNKMHIVYATDEKYLLPTMVALSSAVVHTSRRNDLVVDILDCGIADSNWSVFESNVRASLGEGFGLARHKIDMSSYDDMAAWHTSKGVYSRLEIPNILRDVEWCVYADGDTLFTNDPFMLESIWDSQYAIMGHIDEIGIRQRRWHVENNLPWDEKHRICAGFILMNLEWFRANNGTEKCFRFISKYRPPFNDQDALNYVCYGKIGLLQDDWGIFSCHVYTRTDIRPSCIHYVGELPWNFDFNWHVGYFDVRLLWVKYAQNLLGMKPSDFGGPGYVGWYWRMSYRYLIMVISYALYPLPLFRKRYGWVYKRFQQRKILKSCALGNNK